MSKWTRGMRKSAKGRIKRPSNLTEYQKRKWSNNWKAWARKSSKKHNDKRMNGFKRAFSL